MGYNASCYGNVSNKSPETAENFAKCIRNNSFYDIFIHDCDVIISGNVMYDESMLRSILENCKGGFENGKLEFMGEDRSMWRFIIEDGNWHKEIGRIHWERC